MFTIAGTARYTYDRGYGPIYLAYPYSTPSTWRRIARDIKTRSRRRVREAELENRGRGGTSPPRCRLDMIPSASSGATGLRRSRAGAAGCHAGRALALRFRFAPRATAARGSRRPTPRARASARASRLGAGAGAGGRGPRRRRGRFSGVVPFVRSAKQPDCLRLYGCHTAAGDAGAAF